MVPSMHSGERATLAEYRAEWLGELVPMWRASFESGVGVKDPHPLAEQVQYFLHEVLPHNLIRLAILGGELVGFVAASTESVAQLHVRVGFQRRGIGTKLLEWAKTQSAGSLWLYTFQRNRGACAFYERNSFTPVARGFEPVWQLEDVKYRWSARMHDQP
jgi:ribosomal protein S18 acetylase RimI-like enzyme